MDSTQPYSIRQNLTKHRCVTFWPAHLSVPEPKFEFRDLHFVEEWDANDDDDDDCNQRKDDDKNF